MISKLCEFLGPMLRATHYGMGLKPHKGPRKKFLTQFPRI